jgi:hypothetical protein
MTELMDPAAIPGQRIEVALERRQLDWITRIVAGVWVLFSIICLVPAVGSLVVGRAVGVRWHPFLYLTVAAMFILVSLHLSYRRTAALVFTTEGVWQRRFGGGRFLAWRDVVEVTPRSVRSYPRILVRTPSARLLIHARFLKNPTALLRTIRSHVAPGVAPEDPDEED